MGDTVDLPLRDIHLPDPIGWWPFAPVWWTAFFLLITSLVLLVVVIIRMKNPPLKRRAKRELKRLEARYRSEQCAIGALAGLSAFLRAALIKKIGNEASAGLIGDNWLQLLDNQLQEREFSQGVGKILLVGPYQKEADPQKVDELFLLVHRFVEKL